MTPEIINNVLNHVDTWIWYHSVIRPLIQNIDLMVVLSVFFTMVAYMFKSCQDWEREKVKMGQEENLRQRGGG